jgi:hypothetical protein
MQKTIKSPLRSVSERFIGDNFNNSSYKRPVLSPDVKNTYTINAPDDEFIEKLNIFLKNKGKNKI